MRLVRDVLDNQLVDRNKYKMGKADGVIIDIRDGSPPRVVGIEVGMVTKARRIHAGLARMLARRHAPYLIPWSSVRDVGIDIDIDVDACETPVLNVETRLRRILLRLPFA